MQAAFGGPGTVGGGWSRVTKEARNLASALQSKGQTDASRTAFFTVCQGSASAPAPPRC